MNAPCRLPSAGRRRRKAFTLIELLASIAILVVIVTMIGVIFTESDRAWTLGTNRAENNLAGRAALNMIAHDLQYAVADDILTYVNRKDSRPPSDPLAAPPSPYGFDCDEICFVSIQNDSTDSEPNARRAAREIHYWVRENPAESARFELRRGYWSKSIVTDRLRHSYFSRTWFEPPSLGGAGRPTNNHFIAKNVTAFAVYVPDAAGTLTREYYSAANSNRVPEFADIVIEMLNDREARQAADLWRRGMTVEAVEFVKKNAVRHVTRVYFHNRDGYKPRP